MMAKPMKTLKLHYPMIQFLIISYIEKLVAYSLDLLEIEHYRENCIIYLQINYLHITFLNTIKYELVIGFGLKQPTSMAIL